MRGRPPTHWLLSQDIARRAPGETSRKETTALVLKVRPEPREGPSAQQTRWPAPRTAESRFLDPSPSQIRLADPGVNLRQCRIVLGVVRLALHFGQDGRKTRRSGSGCNTRQV